MKILDLHANKDKGFWVSSGLPQKVFNMTFSKTGVTNSMPAGTRFAFLEKLRFDGIYEH